MFRGKSSRGSPVPLRWKLHKSHRKTFYTTWNSISLPITYNPIKIRSRGGWPDLGATIWVDEMQRKNKWISEQVSIYFITSEIAYLRGVGSEREKHRERNVGEKASSNEHVRDTDRGWREEESERWRGLRERERERERMTEEAVKRSRRKPVRILLISRKVFAQLVSTELGALNRESVLSRLPGIRGERYRPLQCVHFCSRLYVAPARTAISFLSTVVNFDSVNWSGDQFHGVNFVVESADNLTNSSRGTRTVECTQPWGNFDWRKWKLEKFVWMQIVDNRNFVKFVTNDPSTVRLYKV